MPVISSEPIKDLISKILVVDVNQRLTIQQIKEHPAFHLYYPEGYVFPRPLPHPPLDGKLEIDDPEFYNLLQNVGYDNIDQIKEELNEEGPTSAKLFHALYSRVTDLSSLPWSSANDAQVAPMPDFPAVEGFVSSVPSYSGPDAGMTASTAGTNSFESFKDSRHWEFPTDTEFVTMDDDKYFFFPKKVAPATEVCLHMQKDFATRGIDYFFPNDQLFILRDTDQVSYFNVSVKQIHRTAVLVGVLLRQGNPERLDPMKQAIEALLAQYADYVE